MLRAVKSWLDQEKVGDKSRELKLGIVELMVGMMTVNQHIDEFELGEILAFLQQNFAMSESEAQGIMDELLSLEGDTESFELGVKKLVVGYSKEELAYILSIVWRVALVDGEISEDEEAYINHLADLFGVSKQELIALKKAQERDFPDLVQRDDRYQEF